MSYLFLYVVLLPLIAILLIKRKKYHYLFFVLIALLSLIRYDTTTDYEAYVSSFYDIRNYKVYTGLFEPGFVFLNKIFSFSQWGFIPLLMLCIIIPYKQIYKIFKQHDVVLVGSVLFLFLDFGTRFENIIRQGLAIGIFLYAIKYVNKKEWWKYLLLTLLAASFHSSAYVMIVYFFLIVFVKDKKPPVKIAGILTLLFSVLYIVGFWRSIVEWILPQLNFYQNYAEKLETSQGGITPVIRVILCWLPLVFIKDKNKYMVLNLSWISGLLYITLQNLPVVDRIVEYLYIFQVVSISLLIKELGVKYIAVSGTILLFFFLMHVRFVSWYYGNGDYQTIFGQNCAEHKFYFRDIEGIHNNGEIDRKHTYVLKTQ